MYVCICIDSSVGSVIAFSLDSSTGETRDCVSALGIFTHPLALSFTNWLSICDVTVKPIQDGGDEVKKSWDLPVA